MNLFITCLNKENEYDITVHSSNMNHLCNNCFKLLCFLSTYLSRLGASGNGKMVMPNFQVETLDSFNICCTSVLNLRLLITKMEMIDNESIRTYKLILIKNFQNCNK